MTDTIFTPKLTPFAFKDNIERSLCILKDGLKRLPSLIPGLDLDKVSTALSAVESWQDFHRAVLLENMVPSLLANTSDGLSIEGLENICGHESCLFVSNHRDTILDCTLLGYVLLSRFGSFVQPVLGSNLTGISALQPYLTLCGGIVIDRTLTMRELYEQSMSLSRIICHTLSQGRSSIWIAGEAARSKDGIDSVKSSVVKMILLAKGKGETIASFLERITVVPASISYEYDPNDVLKAYALADANHRKTPAEELSSIFRSLRGSKGRISVAFSKPVRGNFENAEALAQRICGEVVAGYRLFPSNFYAYDALEGKSEFEGEYDRRDLDCRFKKFSHFLPSVKKRLLLYYANPVYSALRIRQAVEGLA